MGALILGIGLVFVIEGLFLALLPARLEEVLEAIRNIPLETRRIIGLLAVATGVALVWAARHFGL